MDIEESAAEAGLLYLQETPSIDIRNPIFPRELEARPESEICE